MDRYRAIIDDPDAFAEAVARPATPAIRRNPLKAGDDFQERLQRVFPGAEPAGWHPDVFRLPRNAEPGKTLLHWRGDYYVQEESAAVPVAVLAPGPGERVLDMCAAPGGKTTQIAAALDGEGVVVANEKSSRRIRGLHANVNRTGSTTAVVTHGDGRNMTGTYDRILVDAPCSGEGNRARRDGEPAGDTQIERLAQVQRDLCDRAATLLAPGGTMVYSTCTFTPRENEAVVRHVLDTTDLELSRVALDIPHRRGVTAWQDVTYGNRMVQTLRIYPHHLDSGGMFVARFTR